MSRAQKTVTDLTERRKHIMKKILSLILAITMLCGAFAGARFGIESLPSELLRGLERVSVFDELAMKFYEAGLPKEEPAEEE